MEKMEASDEYKKEYAIRKLVASYRKVLASGAQTWKGVIIGATGRMNMVARRRRDAEKYFRENPEEAIKKGITDKDGNPLHYATPEELEKMPDWMAKRIGTLLPKEDWQRTAFGVVKAKEEWRITQLRLRGENTKVKIPMFTQLTFNALELQSSTEELAKLNDAGTLNFNVEKELSDKEVKNLLQTKFKDNVITISQFDEFCEKHQEWGRFAIIKAIITEINPQPTSMGSQMIRIEDSTMDFLDDKGDVVPPIVCFVDEEMITFPERSEVYIVGQPNVTDRGKNIGVFGIFVPKTFRNLVPNPRSVSTNEETEW